MFLDLKEDGFVNTDNIEIIEQYRENIDSMISYRIVLISGYVKHIATPSGIRILGSFLSCRSQELREV